VPVQSCSEKGKPGYRWGSGGRCYIYSPGNETARKKAKQKAFLQGAAATGGTMKEEVAEWLKGKEDQDLDDYWKELIESGETNQYLEQGKRPQDKPGGSNVGQYPGVKKFCGPSGGAPKGSFPVNTRKRAIAALAYARNAPNPSGIRTCVCRNWPTLPACKKKKGVSETDVDNFMDDCFKEAKIDGIYEHR